MKKRAFLSPAAMSIAALVASSAAYASSQDLSTRAEENRSVVERLLVSESGDSTFILERISDSELQLAQHQSHYSHRSHSSHSSHRSHYSGY